MRSDELQKLRKQVEVFAYEQQGWARQREEMATKVDHVQGKLITYSNYISALEDCCDKTGFPVAAVKQAALDETELETQTESEDDTALACNNRPHRETRNRALVSLWPEKPSLRSPIKTQAKSNDSPKKAVKIAVLKNMTNADDEITTISRPLTCEECSRHKQVVGIMPRKEPFQPYWEALMLQDNVYKLEIRDVWQIALLTIPEELKPKLNTEMKSGNIMNRVNDETDEGIYERLKQALLDMRGLSHADWSKILEIKQAGNESFERYAERLWVTYREHSGLENADRNHDALLQLVKNNAGIPVQKALSNGVDPAENTLSGVLAQDHGGKLRPIAYYSRKKSTIEQGFDPCTQHVLAVHWMLTATEPIVGFQPIVVHTVHTPVQMLLQGRIKGVSSQRLARWLADIQARDITTVNDRILPHLLGDVEGHPHTCQTKQEAQSPVHDQELPNQTQVYIDGSRYWHDGKFHTGCVVWAPHSPNSDNNQLLIKLSEDTSAQEAELIALLEAIRSHHEPLCVYTGSRYAFGTVHDFMAQWQLRKFLTSAGTPIKHLNIITSIWQEIRARDSSLSVVKVRAHIIKNPDENEKNNNIADQLAKLAAQKGDEWKPDRLVVPAVSAIQTIPIDLKQYQQELWSPDGELTPHLQQDQLVKVTEGMILRDDKYIVPEALQKPVIKLYHDYAHVSAPKTQQLIQKNFWWPQMASDIQDGVTHASYVPPLTKASLAVQNCVDQSHPRDLGSYSNWIS